ncbi:siroheme synthase CysG [Rhizobium sp. NFR03]|uniref:siroheme synthase CysG n=1 Tax=Rhizobium sp. NFR03 TaxID=1566263 RepID=UPI0008C0B97F|nr:siroheme synthase CysG [Rhizobium sp. NFR03]SER92486.1 uroporphyrin-III C-methyltransferase / precorrin-2 dehydrogenase / sirohydrochlorin ferrochelatase [Rhizobium sp. NFR03]
MERVSLLRSDATFPREGATARSGARVEALAKLPVFWGLEGKRVILAGGTEGACWKAELLAACGAEVHVYAPEDALCDAFADMLLRHAEDHARGAFVHHPQAWTAGIMSGAALAIADCEEEDEARAFYDAAIAAGVPVNVIDKPAFCQFQFGSIVNRSPVVVAISTDGAAPILAQAIRRRIETLLPQSIKGWSMLAQSLRDAVSARLHPGQERRAFWERFVDRAFTTVPTAQSAADLVAEADRLTAGRKDAQGGQAIGKVTLVGAGPGDAELLTLKAVRALQAADVILFDDLVSGDVLELARREAKRMLVGKRGGRTSCKQEDINAMMVTFARAGKTVVRLKSGDPMVFGRAGEEIACLEAHGIPVDVVPGITAASALASRLGVSLTHRDHTHAVRFITGHSRKGCLPIDVDWRACADPRTTTVFYMGGRTASAIAERLMAEGMAGDMPVVIASNISRAEERRWHGTVSTMHIGIAEIGYDNPVLIGVGRVFPKASIESHALPEETEFSIQRIAI